MPKIRTLEAPVPSQLGFAKPSFLLTPAHERFAQEKIHTNPSSKEICIRQTFISARIRPRQACLKLEPQNPLLQVNLGLQSLHFSSHPPKRKLPKRKHAHPPRSKPNWVWKSQNVGNLHFWGPKNGVAIFTSSQLQETRSKPLSQYWPQSWRSPQLPIRLCSALYETGSKPFNHCDPRSLSCPHSGRAKSAIANTYVRYVKAATTTSLRLALSLITFVVLQSYTSKVGPDF